MLTKYQALRHMLTIDEVFEIKKHLALNDIPDINNQLKRILCWRPVYVTEGTHGEIPLIESLPAPYQDLVDTVLKIKSKNKFTYGGEVSLFKLTAYVIKTNHNCYHQIFKLEPNDYLTE